MQPTLPYEFDSSGVVSTILRGVLGLLALVVVPGILYSIFISHSRAAAVQLLLVAALIAWFRRTLGAELAAALGLPCQERQEPY